MLNYDNKCKAIIIESDIRGNETNKLLSIKNQFNSEDVLYIPSQNRRFLVSKDSIEAIEMALKLSNKFSIKKFVENNLDIKDPFAYERIDLNCEINCGYMQVMNILYSIYNHPSNELVLMIDHFEQGLHVLVLRNLLNTLINIKKIKKIFITTSCDLILNFSKNEIEIHVIHVNQCIN